MDMDKEAETILKMIENSKEPLETKEIEEKLKNISRSKILYRLNQLRAEGMIKGKSIGAGKGNWIWWSKKAFD
jgi:repressor of nif and glnA expression